MERFQSVMDKLFLSPSPSGVQPTGVKKRPNPDSMLAVGQSELVGNTMQEHMCRPWDRGDLMRRLATFKSMKWFAKPKVISAVNCARRGWVSVEMDTIACETCGARMLFSTPSAWTQQQIEKAALVFSLKLDNGHKLHCQWIDNVCDEMLAQFPPTPDLALVDGYRQRFSSLSQLTALPVISSSFIDLIKSQQLEQLLAKFLTIGRDNGSETDTTEYLGNEHEAASASSYYQAQKLIALCGWEPRSLPYAVDCKNKFDQSVKDINHLDLSDVIAAGPNHNVTVYSSGTNETMEMNEDPMVSGGYQTDPNSVVLDCKLCGASVGLWAFSMVPRPLELLRMVGFAEISGVDSVAQENDGFNNAGTLTCTASNIASSTSSNNSMNLSLTIAGGPPPTKQNFRAKISLPVVGRNLRARFFSDSEYSKHKLSEVISGNQDDARLESNNDNLFLGKGIRESNATGEVLQPESMGPVNRTHDKKRCICSSDDCSLNHDACEKGHAIYEENNLQLEERELNEPETSTNHFVRHSTENIVQDCGHMNGLDSNVSDAEVHKSDLSSMAVADSCKEILGDAGNRKTTDSKNSENGSYVKDCSIEKLNEQNDNDIKNRVPQTLATNETVPSATGKDLKRLTFDEAMKFDPIRQHRHFCPWIATTGSSVAPGWHQTLSALLKQKKFLHPSSPNSPSSASASIMKVDDPITSIRNLFTTPKKRMKVIHRSS